MRASVEQKDGHPYVLVTSILRQFQLVVVTRRFLLVLVLPYVLVSNGLPYVLGSSALLYVLVGPGLRMIFGSHFRSFALVVLFVNQWSGAPEHDQSKYGDHAGERKRVGTGATEHGAKHGERPSRRQRRDHGQELSRDLQFFGRRSTRCRKASQCNP